MFMHYIDYLFIMCWNKHLFIARLMQVSPSLSAACAKRVR